MPRAKKYRCPFKPFKSFNRCALFKTFDEHDDFPCAMSLVGSIAVRSLRFVRGRVTGGYLLVDRTLSRICFEGASCVRSACVSEESHK
jgi:hypothetical protein